MTTRVALVTGAGSGIGAAVLRAAAEVGFRVAAIDIDSDAVERVSREAAEASGQITLPLAADVRDETQLEGAFRRCRSVLGVPTAILANAGVEMNGPAHSIPVEDWERTLQVNLTGVFLTARLAIREMLTARIAGSVVCTSSPSAFVGFAGGGNAAYAASKGGISALVRSLALDYAAAGIRVNAVVPGATDTPLLTINAEPAERADVRERLLEAARAQVPLGRLGAPEEVAEAVRWLWSDSASYVTGSHLVVDGGLLAKSANTF